MVDSRQSRRNLFLPKISDYMAETRRSEHNLFSSDSFNKMCNKPYKLLAQTGWLQSWDSKWYFGPLRESLLKPFRKRTRHISNDSRRHEFALAWPLHPTTKTIFGKSFTKEEIKNAFFSLSRNKACGPDVYSPEFFLGCWSIIGVETTEAVEEFFKSGKLLRQWNATSIVLIPNIPNAASTSDFRPNLLLDTVYKIISKLLASRLHIALSKVISNSQSAFIPERLLAENVLLAMEIVHGYNRRNINPRGMLKVDLRKAFDYIRWDFIISALKALYIPDNFVGWISECITSPTFLISVNGCTGGFFKSTQGLRQGDPLSPYLFFLAMEVF